MDKDALPSQDSIRVGNPMQFHAPKIVCFAKVLPVV